jgi:hypothetical protein
MADRNGAQAPKRLIEREIRFGFLRVPAAFRPWLPAEQSGRVTVYLGKNGSAKPLYYKPSLGRIYGLTHWYRQHLARVGDEVVLEAVSQGACRLSYRQAQPAIQPRRTSPTAPARQAGFDPHELNATEKGKLVENRIADLLLLHGHGRLSAYVPVSDTDGVDLVVLHKGRFKQVYLQVKSSFVRRGQGRRYAWDVPASRHRTHPSHLVLCVHFSPGRLQIDEHALLIPSDRLWELALHVGYGRKHRLRITSSLPPSPRGKYYHYACRIQELAAILLNELRLQGRYLR